jgi:hypothetical protein
MSKMQGKIEVQFGDQVEVIRYLSDSKNIYLDLHLGSEEAHAFVVLKPKQARKIAKMLKQAAKPVSVPKPRL